MTTPGGFARNLLDGRLRTSVGITMQGVFVALCGAAESAGAGARFCALATDYFLADGCAGAHFANKGKICGYGFSGGRQPGDAADVAASF
jgi:hypothetical protein